MGGGRLGRGGGGGGDREEGREWKWETVTGRVGVSVVASGRRMSRIREGGCHVSWKEDVTYHGMEGDVTYDGRRMSRIMDVTYHGCHVSWMSRIMEG